MLFTISSTICVALNLITLCAATFAALFSVRLALRGDGEAVEKSVKSVRGEYKFVLFLFCSGIFAFLMSISLMGWYKFHKPEAYAMTFIGVLGMAFVGYLMQRSAAKFYLSKSSRYLSTKSLNKQGVGGKGQGGAGGQPVQQDVSPEDGIP